MPNIEELAYNNDFYHLFQPIYCLSKEQAFGYEALIRSKSNILPDELFRYAMEQNFLFELDSLSIYKAISTYFSSLELLESNAFLFLNVFPSTLVSCSFPALVDKIKQEFDGVCSRIVFEINESMTEGNIWNSASFIETVAKMRDQGFKIAMDDVGEGAITLKKIIELSPDFIKIDKFFSKELFTCRKKQKVIAFFVEYCKGDTILILEGIEHQDELEKAVALGVNKGQGYLLGKPNEIIRGILK
jgi:EAL domain-containing protein (putative c-di-GMP-specific phosphodiesterase class I)